MDFWARMAALVDEHGLHEHPFHVRWAAGELSREEAAEFGAQHRHLLIALATASSSAARVASGELRDHFLGHGFDALERAERYEQAVASAATVDCASTWAGRGRSAAATLAVMYVVDGERSDAHREFLELEIAAGADHDELLDAAQAALEAGWRMLDCVDRLPAAA